VRVVVVLQLSSTSKQDSFIQVSEIYLRGG